MKLYINDKCYEIEEEVNIKIENNKAIICPFINFRINNCKYKTNVYCSEINNNPKEEDAWCYVMVNYGFNFLTIREEKIKENEEEEKKKILIDCPFKYCENFWCNYILHGRYKCELNDGYTNVDAWCNSAEVWKHIDKVEEFIEILKKVKKEYDS